MISCEQINMGSSFGDGDDDNNNDDDKKKILCMCDWY